MQSQPKLKLKSLPPIQWSHLPSSFLWTLHLLHLGTAQFPFLPFSEKDGKTIRILWDVGLI